MIVKPILQGCQRQELKAAVNDGVNFQVNWFGVVCSAPDSAELEDDY